MLINKFNRIEKEIDQGNIFWYSPKHNYSVPGMCYGVKILLDFQNEKRQGHNQNLTEYYKNKAKNVNYSHDLNITTTHRALINSAYFGLLHGVQEPNIDRRPSIVYNKIEELTKGDFYKISHYYHLIESQCEKFYLQREPRGDSDDNEFKYLIHPLMILYKFLLLLSQYTNNYKITKNEFNAFVCTIKSYDDIYSNLNMLLKSRILYHDKVERIADSTNDIRIQHLFVQLKTLNFSNSEVSLELEFIEEIQSKVTDYELYILPILTRQNADTALYSTKNLFEYFNEVSANDHSAK